MTMKHKHWKKKELELLHAYKALILQECGGERITDKSPSLIELAGKLPGRSIGAVHWKVRDTLQREGVLKQRYAEEKQPQAVGEVVSIPLSKLYGKVDYETFMSFINE